MDFMQEYAPRRSVRWDIQVDDSIKENSVEYNHATGVVIHANSLDVALGLVGRGRELVDKYPDNTRRDP